MNVNISWLVDDKVAEVTLYYVTHLIEMRYRWKMSEFELAVK